MQLNTRNIAAESVRGIKLENVITQVGKRGGRNRNRLIISVQRAYCVASIAIRNRNGI